MATATKTKPKPKAKPVIKGKLGLKTKTKTGSNSKTKAKSGIIKKQNTESKENRNKYLKDLQERGKLFNRIPHEKGVWQLQEAKARFSEVVKASQEEPQIITVHGKEEAVLLSYDEFIELTTPQMSAWEFFRNSPLYGVELEIPPRLVEPDRDINL